MHVFGLKMTLQLSHTKIVEQTFCATLNTRHLKRAPPLSLDENEGTFSVLGFL